jgi:hypothetical protein
LCDTIRDQQVGELVREVAEVTEAVVLGPAAFVDEGEREPPRLSLGPPVTDIDPNIVKLRDLPPEGVVHFTI